MPRKKREPQYRCQYCERSLDNLTTKNSHELACLQNPKNIKIQTEESTTKTETHAEPQEKDKNKPESKTKEVEEKLREDDEILQKYPTIRQLIGDVGELKKVPVAIASTKAEVASLSSGVASLSSGLEEVKTVISDLVNKISTGVNPPPETQEEPKNKAVNIEEALQASRKANTIETGQKPLDGGSKIDEMRKQAKEKETQGGEQSNPPMAGLSPSTAAIMQTAPEGLQKIFPWIVMAKELGLIRGGEQPQSAQTPDDMRMIERVYANMTSVFSGALKLTQGFRQDARKEVLDELTSSYDLIPKRIPPTKETPSE